METLTKLNARYLRTFALSRRAEPSARKKLDKQLRVLARRRQILKAKIGFKEEADA